MTDRHPVRTGLLSVSDKTGLPELALALAARGVRLLSTGGTAAVLREAGCSVTDVAEITGFPEILDGRVKTLHPAIHGALLARRDVPAHTDALGRHGIAPIDLVVVNLYPFEAARAAGADFATMVETVDIGGPAMLRAAAKNHDGVVVLTDPEDYAPLLAELDAGDGTTTTAFRRRLAATAFARTAAYDAAVADWLSTEVGETAPRRRTLAGRLAQPLRYGENPHQRAAFYISDPECPGLGAAEQVQGKPLSYNNINDTDAALALAAEFEPDRDGPACVIVKHANPCGVARGDTATAAHARALEADPTSAFGSIVALNVPLDGAAAAAITRVFTEVVIAPGADAEARAIFSAKPNLRLLLLPGLPHPDAAGGELRAVSGGFLWQDRDTGRLPPADLRVVTRRPPDPREHADLLFAWTVAKHVKSNAIVYARDGRTVGVGAGQMSRIDSTRIAARKAADMAAACGSDTPMSQGSVVASDAFFPFADGLLAAAEAGATAVIQPGGSVRDAEVIAAADSAGLAMVFTGRRHFRH